MYGLQRWCMEVVLWRYLQHPNVLPLLGVKSGDYQFSMVCEWMDNGNINEFVKNYDGVNRAQLVSN